jgi:hypothetical protein
VTRPSAKAKTPAAKRSAAATASVRRGSVAKIDDRASGLAEIIAAVARGRRDLEVAIRGKDVARQGRRVGDRDCRAPGWRDRQRDRWQDPAAAGEAQCGRSEAVARGGDAVAEGIRRLRRGLYREGPGSNWQRSGRRRGRCVTFTSAGISAVVGETIAGEMIACLAAPPEGETFWLAHRARWLADADADVRHRGRSRCGARRRGLIQTVGFLCGGGADLFGRIGSRRTRKGRKLREQSCRGRTWRRLNS